MDDPNRTQLGSPVSDPNRTVMGGAPSLNATVTIKPIQCPVCKSFNPPGVAWCNDCGLVFEMALDGDAFGAPAVRLPVLVASTGREYVLRPGTNVIGRAGDIEIDDPRVSRRHCAVHLDGNDVSVEDLGSTNGTKIGGVPVPHGSKAALSNGAVASLGGFELTLSLPGESNKTIQAVSGRTTSIAAAPTIDTVVAWLCIADAEIPINKGRQIFGRREDNDIVVSDPYVSGNHGYFEATDTELSIVDTGSTNGTFLNGARLGQDIKTVLRPDDELRFGGLEVKIRFKQGG